jgi:hypothetical protein
MNDGDNINGDGNASSNISSSQKKRSWGHVMHPLPSASVGATKSSSSSSSSTTGGELGNVLEKYRSLALVHRTSAKRRKLNSARRTAQTAKRIGQIVELRNVAQKTLSLCQRVLHDEEQVERDEEEEAREDDREMTLADNLLDSLAGLGCSSSRSSRIIGGGDGISGFLDLGRSKMDETDDSDGGGNSASSSSSRNDEDVLIGGIPSRFLDLSHFPHLKKKTFQNNRVGQHHRQSSHRRGISSDILSPDKDEVKTKSDLVQHVNSKKRPVIDCTEDFAIPHRHHHRIPSFGGQGEGGDILLPSSSSMSLLKDRNEGIPRELTVPHYHHHHHPDSSRHNSSSSSKRNVRRAYVANASLSHVNGTYVSDGCYNDAPLFVRAGGPRKFMGKDCHVVIRRERVDHPVPAVDVESYVMEQRSSSRSGGGVMGGNIGGRKGGRMQRFMCDGNDDDCSEQQQQQQAKLSSTGYMWKIGLVPSNCVFHPRIICYFIATGENNSNMTGVVVDRMDESDDDENGETFFDPPPDGWVSSSPDDDILGRASSLKISYE